MARRRLPGVATFRQRIGVALRGTKNIPDLTFDARVRRNKAERRRQEIIRRRRRQEQEDLRFLSGG